MKPSCSRFASQIAARQRRCLREPIVVAGSASHRAGRRTTSVGCRAAALDSLDAVEQQNRAARREAARSVAPRRTDASGAAASCALILSKRAACRGGGGVFVLGPSAIASLGSFVRRRVARRRRLRRSASRPSNDPSMRYCAASEPLQRAVPLGRCSFEPGQAAHHRSEHQPLRRVERLAVAARTHGPVARVTQPLCEPRAAVDLRVGNLVGHAYRGTYRVLGGNERHAPERLALRLRRCDRTPPAVRIGRLRLSEAWTRVDSAFAVSRRSWVVVADDGFERGLLR